MSEDAIALCLIRPVFSVPEESPSLSLLSLFLRDVPVVDLLKVVDGPCESAGEEALSFPDNLHWSVEPHWLAHPVPVEAHDGASPRLRRGPLGLVLHDSRGVGVHSLRKTGITNALNNGASVLKVQQLTGHADVKTT